MSAIGKVKPLSDQRHPITLPLLQGLVEAVTAVSLSPFDSILYSAMMLLAFYACLRVGEIAVSRNLSNIIQASQISAVGRPEDVKVYRINFINYKHIDGSNPTVQISKDVSQKF